MPMSPGQQPPKYETMKSPLLGDREENDEIYDNMEINFNTRRKEASLETEEMSDKSMVVIEYVHRVVYVRFYLIRNTIKCNYFIPRDYFFDESAIIFTLAVFN